MTEPCETPSSVLGTWEGLDQHQTRSRAGGVLTGPAHEQRRQVGLHRPHDPHLFCEGRFWPPAQVLSLVPDRVGQGPRS